MNDKLRIIKYGVGMNSPFVARRHLYIHYYCNSCNSHADPLSDVLAVGKKLVNNWRVIEPTIMMPWWESMPCASCRKRGEYERRKHLRGDYYWRRRYCMRHYLVQHLACVLNEDDIYTTNRRINVNITREYITFSTRTVNYHYAVVIERDAATMRANYKGRDYIFTYRHHLNVRPLLSSYEYLLHTVLNIVDTLVEMPVKWVKGEYWLHIFLNDREVITLPPREEQ
jgi:hypothetical protein